MTTDIKPTYTDLELRHALTDVFKSVYFVNKRTKNKLQGSYFLNFHNLVNYARDNNIDEIKYIHSIRDVLLKMPQTYEVR
ncbi:MAG: hypothetical protein IJU89_03305 [Alphaproteobacteria bacterium]|nr:hypothetical protein [Alphaproteobacteria bacterium]MBR4507222.1 hypothetical protein [Alphaproteobacteria bacterium]